MFVVTGPGNRFFVLYLSNSPYEVCESTKSAIVDVQHFVSVVIVCRKDDEPDAARVHEFRVSLHTVLMNVGWRTDLFTVFEYPRVAIAVPRGVCISPAACMSEGYCAGREGSDYLSMHVIEEFLCSAVFFVFGWRVL